jgi:hypothetical protein
VVFTVSVEPLPLVTALGLKLPLAPEGNPDTLNATELADPEVVAVPIEYDVPVPPAVTVWVAGLALIEKSFTVGAVTTNVTPAECVSAPLVPVTVRL